jgi:hypothetical protein
MRLLAAEESAKHIATARLLSLYQSQGATSMQLETLQTFNDAGALIMPLIVEDITPTTDVPDWVPLGGGQASFIPRAYLVCFILNHASYAMACNGAALADLQPWRPGDGDAYALIVTIISQARNGVARLIVAFSERAEQHPSFPHMKEVMWYTRTAKGLALTQYFQGKETGRTVTRTFANGKTQTMPIFVLAVADWHQHVDAVVEKLVDIESHFSDTLAEVHQKLQGR